MQQLKLAAAILAATQAATLEGTAETLSTTLPAPAEQALLQTEACSTATSTATKAKDYYAKGVKVTRLRKAKYKGKNGCSNKKKCSEGQGDCDKNSHCKGSLQCFQIGKKKLGKYFHIPGVYGTDKIKANNYKHDFCYNPNWLGFKKYKNLKKNKRCKITKNCDVGQGDCNKDSDCKKGLKCFQRGKKNKSIVPGVYMAWRWQKTGNDVCYDPKFTVTNRMPGQDLGSSYCSKKKPCNIGEGDCDRDSHCKGHLKCFQRTYGEQVPGVELSKQISPKTDICYDPRDWEGLMMAERQHFWCSKKKTCGIGQGPCKYDSGCKGKLKCYRRTKGESVPGVEGVQKVVSDKWNVCYDPAWEGQMPQIKEKKKLVSGGIGQGPCTKNSQCKGKLKCMDPQKENNGLFYYPGVIGKDNMKTCVDPKMPYEICPCSKPF